MASQRKILLACLLLTLGTLVRYAEGQAKNSQQNGANGRLSICMKSLTSEIMK